MEKHPFFMRKPVEGQELPPLVEALQQLKYDPEVNSPKELALSYKEDGNQNLKQHKYHWAVDSYTKGLEAKCDDPELNAQLYCNRANAHYHIGNFKKSLKDATEARNLKPDHIKAFYRGAMCCMELQLYQDCISWCVDGLKLDEQNKTLLDLKKKAEEKKKLEDISKTKAQAEEWAKVKERSTLKKEVKKRGISLVEGDKIDLSALQPMHPAVTTAKVSLDENNRLSWPVMLIYPEYGVTDFIKSFHEDTCFRDLFISMFMDDDPPPWDMKREYTPESMQVYFSDGEDTIIPIDKDLPLRSVLTHKMYKVHGGIPSFIITVSNSEFDGSYRKKYRVIDF
ncbi:tetratricopeptide repeat protein 4-like [Stegodyphus dumicola]|uniref:tetratricopeptide repeat protein 4-like n=1 Tax=Stegodyphus dumicola TaxID=202533 RepID=UPI0015B132EF|nr:tetratricopeptide repeat protein 4-like [Stegodyphus dumicola]